MKTLQATPPIGVKSLWQLVKVGLAVVLVAFVLSRTSWHEATSVWHHLSLPWLLLSITAYYGTLIVSTRRSWTLLDEAVPFGELLEATIIQTVVTNIIATGAGLVSYLAVLRRKHQVPLGTGILTLVLPRLADGVVLGLIVVGTAASVWQQIAPLYPLIVVIGVGTVALCLLLAALGRFRRALGTVLGQLTRTLHIDALALTGRVLGTIQLLVDTETLQLRRRTRQVLGYAVLTQSLTLAFAYGNMRLFNLPISPLPLALIVALTQLLSLIPIQVFGGLGVYDVTMLFLYGLFGLGQATVVPVLIGLRLTFYIYNLLLLLYLPWQKHHHAVASLAPAGLAEEQP